MNRATLPVRDLQFVKGTAVKWLAIPFAALVLALAAPAVLADAPPIVTIWHTDAWLVVASSPRSVLSVASYPDLTAAKHGANALGGAAIDWHGVYQASVPTDCGTLTGEDERADGARELATNLAAVLGCAPTSAVVVRYLT